MLISLVPPDLVILGCDVPSYSSCLDQHEGEMKVRDGRGHLLTNHGVVEVNNPRAYPANGLHIYDTIMSLYKPV